MASLRDEIKAGVSAALVNAANALKVRGLPAGGTTGQSLVKTSATAYATDWETRVKGMGADTVVVLTQAAYDALATKSATTIYLTT